MLPSRRAATNCRAPKNRFLPIAQAPDRGGCEEQSVALPAAFCLPALCCPDTAAQVPGNVLPPLHDHMEILAPHSSLKSQSNIRRASRTAAPHGVAVFISREREPRKATQEPSPPDQKRNATTAQSAPAQNSPREDILRPIRKEGVEDARHRADPRTQRNLVTLQPARTPGPIKLLPMQVHDIRRRTEGRGGRAPFHIRNKGRCA